MKKMFCLTTLVVLIFASQSLALYNVMDRYAVEVLLNKPGMAHNLDFMNHADNVTIQKNVVTYRSNFDNRVAVILESVSAGDNLNGLSVRLQMPVREDTIPHVQSIVKFKDASIDDVGQGFLESLGYHVDIVMRDGDRNNPDEEPVIDRPIIPLPVDEKPGAEAPVEDTSHHDAEDMPGMSVDEAISVDNDNPNKGPDEIYSVPVQVIFLSKGNIGWNIVHYEDVDGSGVDFMLNIMNAEAISDEAREDFQQMVAFYEFGRDAQDQLNENMQVMRSVYLVLDMDISVDEFDSHAATKTELEWLKANAVIIGVTDQDISEISRAAKTSLAGWNSRIVYSDGNWLPYYESGGADLILLEEAPIAMPMDVPDGTAEFPTTSVSPKEKSITQWGRIKGNPGS